MGCVGAILPAAAFAIIIMKMVQHGHLGLLLGARNTQRSERGFGQALVVPDLRRRAGASLPSREGALGHSGSPLHLVGHPDRILPRTGYLCNLPLRALAG